MKFLAEREFKDKNVIDVYSKLVWKGIHPTFTVRTMPSNNYFIYEEDVRSEQNERQEG